MPYSLGSSEQCKSRWRKDCCYTKHNRTLSPAKDARNERANSKVRAAWTKSDHIIPHVVDSQKQAEAALQALFMFSKRQG